MKNRIDTVEGRNKLAVRNTAYWQKISNGCHLGFRKMTKQSEGSWIAQFYDPSTQKQIRQSLGSFSEFTANLRFDQAKKKAEGLFQHLRQGGNHEVISVKDACERYCTALIEKGELKNSKDINARFERWVYKDKISGIHLTKLTQKHLDEWRNQLKKTEVVINPHAKAPSKRPRAASTLNRDMAPLKAALNFAKEQGWVTTDMAWKTPLKSIKNASKRRTDFLDRSQRDLLISKASGDLAVFLRGLSLVPLRPGALANLKVSSIDTRTGNLTIELDKGKDQRAILLTSATFEFFRNQTVNKLPNAPLFARVDGVAWNKDSWKKPIKAAVKEAGLPETTSAYTFRHSTITELVTNGLDLLTVAQLAGTSVVMIEKHYGQFRAFHAAKALEKLA